MPWAEFVEGLPACTGVERGPRGPALPTITDEDEQMFAWLKKFRKRDVAAGGGRDTGLPAPAGGAGKGAGQGAGAGGDAESGDDDIVDAFAGVEEVRAAWATEEDVVIRDFVVQIRGGKWTRKHKDAWADSYRGAAKVAGPLAWCRKYKLLTTATFAIKTFKGAVSRSHRGVVPPYVLLLSSVRGVPQP